ncbi:MAG: hypothetical protein D9V44_00500 [Actinobacteria bacterium]|nr:MAG: hypothetical protein D9V44_00500 [Actinomycetota bacterium]
MPGMLIRIALATIVTLTLVVALPAISFAQDNAAQTSAQPVTARTTSPFATTEQPDGTIADDLALAVVATVAGCAFVYFVFTRNRNVS